MFCFSAVRTIGGTTDGSPCHFPFSYNGVDYNECEPDPKNQNLGWCATTRNYDGNWGYCAGTICF